MWVYNAWREWLEAMSNCIGRNVQKRVIKHFKGSPWVDQEFGSLEKAKLKANRCAKRSEKVSDWTAYRKLTNLVKSKWHKKNKSFIQELGLSVKTNPKKCWSYVKSKTGSGAMPQDKFLKGEKLSTPELTHLPNIFSQSFQTMIIQVIHWTVSLTAKKTIQP